MRRALPAALLLALAALALVVPTPTALVGKAAAANRGVAGHWLVANERAIIRLEPCGPTMCGRLAWLSEPYADDGGPKRDTENPDPSRRGRPLCGLRLVSGLERAGADRWEDGEIYNSRDGSIYGLDVELSGPDTLSVRGYLGVRLFGRTQKWTRVGGDRGGCPTRFLPGNDR